MDCGPEVELPPALLPGDDIALLPGDDIVLLLALLPGVELPTADPAPENDDPTPEAVLPPFPSAL